MRGSTSIKLETFSATLRSGTYAALLSLMIPSGNALAQALLRGRVVDSLSTAAVAGATIELISGDVRQLSDSGGRFSIRGVAPGKYLLEIRRIGFRPRSDSVSVPQSDTSEHLYLLQRAAVEIREVVVSGRSVSYPASLEPAYRRAARGRGFFITREEIEQADAQDYQNLLNRIPGVSANDRGVTFQRCQLGLEKLSRPDLKPKVQVWIDGFRMSLDANDASGVYGALRSVRPRSIQLMEVYSSISTIPAEFLNDACAVIVIWTKRD